MGLPRLAKIEYFPYNRSQIYFRIENLEDKFDEVSSKHKKLTPYVNVTLLSRMLYEKVKGKEMRDD